MCPAIKLTVHKVSTSSNAALIPPPDGGEVLPTSASDCHRQLQHSWRHELHAHGCRAEVRPGSGERREYPEWRWPGCGDDPSTARNGWLPLHDKTADRVETGRCMTTNVCLHDTPRREVAIPHCEVSACGYIHAATC